MSTPLNALRRRHRRAGLEARRLRRAGATDAMARPADWSADGSPPAFVTPFEMR
jgi:hypothetical protein